MDTNQLIDQLSDDLTPTALLRPRRLARLALLGLAVAVVAVLSVFQLRADYMAALAAGPLVWKSGLFLLVAASAYFWLIPASLAGRPTRKWYALPLAMGTAFFIFKLSETLLTASSAELMGDVFDWRAPYCLGTVTILGGLILAVIWRGWLRQATPMHGPRAGLLAGILAAALAASAYALHCDQDSPVYMVLYYGLPMMLLGFVGYMAGRTLRW